MRTLTDELLAHGAEGDEALSTFASSVAAELASQMCAAATTAAQRAPQPNLAPPPKPKIRCPVQGCSKEYATPSSLASHVSEKHPDLPTSALAHHALGRCPAAGCGRVFSLIPTGTNPRSGLQQHLVNKAKEPEHARAVSAAGGIAKLDTDARARAAATAAAPATDAAAATPTAAAAAPDPDALLARAETYLAEAFGTYAAIEDVGDAVAAALREYGDELLAHGAEGDEALSTFASSVAAELASQMCAAATTAAQQAPQPNLWRRPPSPRSAARSRAAPKSTPPRQAWPPTSAESTLTSLPLPLPIMPSAAAPPRAAAVSSA